MGEHRSWDIRTTRYGTVYLSSGRGKRVVDGIAKTRIARRWHALGPVTTVLCMFGGLAGLFFAATWVTVTSQEPTTLHEPANLIAIPGLNELMALSSAGYIFLALVLAAAIHECGHAIAARIHDIEIVEFGLVFLGPIPMGAYVQPEDEGYRTGSERARLEVLSAGVLNNVAVGLLAGALLEALPGVGLWTGVEAYLLAPILGEPVGAASAFVGFCFWLCLFNVNLAVVNAAPVGPMDGGRLVGSYAERVGLNSRLVVAITSIIVVTAFVLAAIGPFLLNTM